MSGIALVVIFASKGLGCKHDGLDDKRLDDNGLDRRHPCLHEVDSTKKALCCRTTIVLRRGSHSLAGRMPAVQSVDDAALQLL